MNLEQTKKLVNHFFSNTDKGVVMMSSKAEEEARSWLEQNGYFFKEYDGVYCIAKLEEFIPSEEKAKEMKAEMEERVRKAEEEQLRSDIATLRAAEFAKVPF